MKTECPQCKHEFNIAHIAKIGDDNRFTVFMQAEKGRLLSAKTVAGVIENTAELMIASAKSLGGNVAVLVEKIASEGDKTSVTFLITAKEKRTKG